MPYAKIETNIKLDSIKEQEFLKKASAFFAVILKKPEDKVMVSVYPDTALIFGKNTAPAAYVELKSMALNEALCKTLSQKICGFLSERLGIQPERTYIEFSRINGKMFGCNSKTY